MEALAQQPEPIPMGGVPSTEIMKVWHMVEPMIQRVISRESGHTIDSVLTALQLAKMQLWVIGKFQGIVVTEIQDRPAGRVLFTLFLAGSDMKEWLDDWCELQDEYAQANGCVAVEFYGRKGWNKIRETRPEWKNICTIYRREFE